MNIDRIKVSVEYTYHGLSRWVGMEASLDESDKGNEKECLKSLETTAREFIQESVKKQAQETPVIQQEPKKTTGFTYWENEINKCTKIENTSTTILDGLESFRTIADTNPKLKEVFNNRLNELKNGLE